MFGPAYRIDGGYCEPRQPMWTTKTVYRQPPKFRLKKGEDLYILTTAGYVRADSDAFGKVKRKAKDCWDVLGYLTREKSTND